MVHIRYWPQFYQVHVTKLEILLTNVLVVGIGGELTTYSPTVGGASACQRGSVQVDGKIVPGRADTSKGHVHVYEVYM